MRKALLIVALLGCSFSHALMADGPTPYPDPKDEAAWPGRGVIRLFPDWMPQNRQVFWDNREKDQGKIVFVGDSLTMSWKSDVLKEAFPDLAFANRGIGGDTSRGVLFRFKEDVLDLHPRAIMLMVGTNDLGAHGDLAATQENIEAMLDMIKAQDPYIPVILVKAPPCAYTKFPPKPGSVQEYARRIDAIWEARPELIRLDLYEAMRTEEGQPRPEYFADDMVHLKPEGYQCWLDLLKPLISKLQLTGR